MKSAQSIVSESVNKIRVNSLYRAHLCDSKAFLLVKILHYVYYATCVVNIDEYNCENAIRTDKNIGTCGCGCCVNCVERLYSCWRRRRWSIGSVLSAGTLSLTVTSSTATRRHSRGSRRHIVVVSHGWHGLGRPETGGRWTERMVGSTGR